MIQTKPKPTVPRTASCGRRKYDSSLDCQAIRLFYFGFLSDMLEWSDIQFAEFMAEKFPEQFLPQDRVAIMQRKREIDAGRLGKTVVSGEATKARDAIVNKAGAVAAQASLARMPESWVDGDDED